MLTQRQTELFKLIVEEHIKTAKPIGSKSLCEKLQCSSATIRNEMSELERLGLLEKTHTSSGRIPSDQGYRYYVDHIMKPKELTGEDVLNLQTIFRNNSLILSDTILKSMEIVSEITNYTAVVLGNSSKTNRVSKVEVVSLDSTDENNFIALVITDTGHVEHKKMYLKEKISLNDIKNVVEIINKHIVGTPIDEVSAKLEFEVKPIISEEIKQREVLYNAFYNVFTDLKNTASVKVNNPSHILKEPEFKENAPKMREILEKFEDKEMIKTIEETEEGVHVYIGSENHFDDDVTIIKTKYSINGEEGTLALIGPKRMEYEKVTSLLNYIIKNLERK